MRPRTAVNGLHPVALIALAAGLLAGCTRSRDVVVIKLAHGLDQGLPVLKAMGFFGERLAEKSGGTLRVGLDSGGQLGTERKCLKLLQMGGLGRASVCWRHRKA